MIFHQETCRYIGSTQRASGLRQFVAKLSSSNEARSDLLYSIHSRAEAFRNLSLASIQLAFMAKLLVLDAEHGTVLVGSGEIPKSQVPATLSDMQRAAEKLGAWFAVLSISEIASILRIEF
jgi:hypothetical protein